MTNLLHLSDLHFGYDQDATARAQRAEALELLVDELGKLRKDWKPDMLVISGDLTWKGKPEGYTELAEWLTERLFPATGLAAHDCVICPGNHDLDRKKARSLLDRTGDAKRADEVLRPEELVEGFARPFHAFVQFADEFGIPAPRLHDAPNYLAGVRELRGIRFVCLNSAWFCRDRQTDRSQLWLGLPQLQSMGLKELDSSGTAQVTIALVHHPQDWFAIPESNAYENRPGGYVYLAARAHAILSGHTHGAVQRANRFDRAWLLLAGASYDSHDYRNNFSILRIDPDQRTIVRRPWELDPRVPRWEEKARQTYSLRIESIAAGRDTANPAKYLAWLRQQTQFIELHQLKVGPGETPPPAIDSLYVRLTTPGHALRSEQHDSGKGAGGTKPEPLEAALRHRKLVIEGKPGGGKTTFVRWIAWALCRPAGPPDGLPVRGFPLLIRISLLDQHIANTLQRGQPGDPATAVDARWIGHFLASQGWGLDETFFREKLESEDSILLVDGLDEATNQARREKIVETIKLAAAQYGCRIVVTSRPGAHEGRATLVGFEKALIDDLDDNGIERFLLQWCRWLKRGDEAAAQSYYGELRPAVAVPSIHILARNPLMLTALAVLYMRRTRLPQQRAQLYEQIMDWLAEQAVDKHPEYLKDERLSRFGYLALGMQLAGGGQKLQIGIDTAAALITQPRQSLDPARRFLEQAQIDSGIVTLRGGEIAFWHRSFQEYLAARAMAGFPDRKLWQHARKCLYSPEGREVLPLLAGRMAESARERLDSAFEDLTKHAAAQARLARKAHAAGVLGNMLSDLAPLKPEYKLKGSAARHYAELRAAVMAIFEKDKARSIGLKTRVAAAEALDQASQARLNCPGNPDYWVPIRGDTFTIGGDPEAFRSLNARSVTVPAFQIGRFPVTVSEYGRYLDETDATRPPDWDEQILHPGRPVTRVTWHEAQFYCERASRKWGIRCKLPTERQWEFAARGVEGRIYPWGPEEPDEHRANFDMKVGQPTPVGLFPGGDTPEGVADMAGNVWEWTRDDFDEDSKVVRGASFIGGARNLRAACRFRLDPVNWNDNFGFRCVRE